MTTQPKHPEYFQPGTATPNNVNLYTGAVNEFLPVNASASAKQALAADADSTRDILKKELNPSPIRALHSCHSYIWW